MGSCLGKNETPKDSSPIAGKDNRSLAQGSLDLREVVAATGNFSEMNKVGEGGFGFVYKGRLASSKVGMIGNLEQVKEPTEMIDVAVKRMKTNDSFQYEQFMNEIAVMQSLRAHPNIVGILAYCTANGKEACIIYEFMPKGNLAEAIEREKDERCFLSWVTRIKIAKDVANALLFMHEKNMIHRDMKSSNILLSEDLTAKISDMGLVKSCGEETFKNTMGTRVMGSLGYIDPSYFQTGELSPKSDVYSYGVILLELISGRLAFKCGKEESFARSMEGLLKSPKVEFSNFVDPKLEGSFNQEQFIKLVMIASCCVVVDRSKRADMAYVVKLLQKYV